MKSHFKKIIGLSIIKQNRNKINNLNVFFKTSQKYITKNNYLTIPLPVENKTLEQHDPELYNLLQSEKKRQFEGLELIASENYTSKSVMTCLGSFFTNKISEGLPGARYYGGTEFVDKVEILAQNRLLEGFGLEKSEWGVNVQSYSGSPAVFSAYCSVMEPGDRLMGLYLYDGGHLTHGFKTPEKKISASSIFFESLSYRLDPNTGLIDYDELERSAIEFKPKVIVAGFSAYPRFLDFKRFREICDKVGAYLISDISHVSGLIATGHYPSPFPYSDLVVSTTHKSLRSARAAALFYNHKKYPELIEKANASVFPMTQGGPHNNTIAAIATQMKEVMSPEFKNYSHQVVKNAKYLADLLMKKGYKLMSNGTDCHLLLWDVKSAGITGAKFEKLGDLVHITVNKNTIAGDKSAMNPSGVRIGVCALTSRGFLEKDMEVVCEFLDRIVKIANKIQKKSGKKLSDFIAAATEDEEVKNLAFDVKSFTRQFHIPALDREELQKLL